MFQDRHFVILLASPEFEQSNQAYDMAKNFCFDLNITSANAAGTVYIYLQNDDPETSSFTTTEIKSFVVSSGLFPSSKSKVTIDSNGFITSRYVGIKWARTSGVGSIAIDGQKTY